jgi:glutathione S-transferase
MENLLAKLNTPFCAGDEMTYADLNLAIFVDRFIEKLGNLDKYPHIKSIADKVNAHAKIAEWKAKRPVTQF